MTHHARADAVASFTCMRHAEDYLHEIGAQGHCRHPERGGRGQGGEAHLVPAEKQWRKQKAVAKPARSERRRPVWHHACGWPVWHHCVGSARVESLLPRARWVGGITPALGAALCGECFGRCVGPRVLCALCASHPHELSTCAYAPTQLVLIGRGEPAGPLSSSGSCLGGC